MIRQIDVTLFGIVHGISTLILVRHYHYTNAATIEQIIIMYRYTGVSTDGGRGIKGSPPAKGVIQIRLTADFNFPYL